MTRNQRHFDSAVMMSSVMPSTKYPCSGSPVTFLNGRTAIDGRSASGRGATAFGGVEGAPALFSEKGAIGTHRPGDVLDLLLTHVLERDGELVAHLVAHHPADADAARFGQGFEARRDVDAIAEDVLLIDHDVAEVDADAKFDASLFRPIGVAPSHLALHLERTTYRIDHAGEFDKQTVARCLDDAATVLRYLEVDDLAPHLLQSGEGAFFIDAHQAGIAGDVSRQDCRQAPLDPVLCHCRRCRKWLMNLS